MVQIVTVPFGASFAILAYSRHGQQLSPAKCSSSSVSVSDSVVDVDCDDFDSLIKLMDRCKSDTFCNVSSMSLPGACSRALPIILAGAPTAVAPGRNVSENDTSCTNLCTRSHVNVA